MGHQRDAEMFALDDARSHGYNNGERAMLASVASDLDVDPEIVDNLDNELALPSRVARLETIAQSVSVLLETAREQLTVLQDGSAAEVANFIITDQLPDLDTDHKYSYIGSRSVYRLQPGEYGEVTVQTDVWGGPTIGPYSFGDHFSLTAEWVSERLTVRGVTRDADLCEAVVTEISARITNPGDLNG